MKVPWSKPDIGIEEKNAVNRVLDSGWVTMGSETGNFERELEKYLGCRHVVFVNNGTAALFSAIIVKNKRILLLPSYNYPVMKAIEKTANYTVCYQDVNPKTCLMAKPDYVVTNLTTIPVSFAGLPLSSDEWIEHKDVMIEDAAESFGAESRGVKTGAQGWTATFSFHVAKLITTVEGGAIATDSDEEYSELRRIRHRATLNYQPTDIVSAIGRVQLKKIERYLFNRSQIANYYVEELNDLVGYQEVPDYVNVHTHMMFPIFITSPANVAFKLEKLGVETRLGWSPSYGTKSSQWISDKILCLPIFNTMSLEEAEYVVECLKKCL